jgi:peptide/nickel transport system substrate-binding protein
MRSFLVLVALIVMFSACTRAPQSVDATGRHAWTVPHVLRIADTADPDHLNPYLSTMDITYDISSLVYSFLVISDARGHLIGDLATDVPTLANGGISKDGRTYTYHLRSGVLWHDGQPFTSRDVAASWRAVIDPAHSTLHREGYDRIASIDTPNDTTVVVHLKERYPPFVTQFFAPLQEGGKPILPAHVLERDPNFNQGELSSHPIGTGPFRFVRWDRGNEIVLERFDGYFKGKPKLERVQFRFIPNDETILNELTLHHLDLVVAPQLALLERYRGISGITTDLVPWNAQMGLIINSRKPGLNDVAVRQAIARSVDYAAIIDKVTHGSSEVARNSLPPTAIGYEALPRHAYDLSSATALLDRAGWKRGPEGIREKNGTRLAFTVATIVGSTSIARDALLMQESVRKAGIDLTIKPYPYNTIFALDGPIYKGKYDLAIYSTTLTWDPNVYFYLACDKWYPKGENTYGYCNPELDSFESAGLQTDETTGREKAYRKASRIIWDTIPYLPLYELRRPFVRSADLKGASDNPSSTPWWNAWQWDI